MRLNGFSLGVIGGYEKGNSGYVVLQHCQQYSLLMKNDRDVKCDVYVKIDGHKVGAWRIEANSHIVIERPVDDTGKFTFYKLDSNEAIKAALQTNNELGLISAEFKPEAEDLILGAPMRYDFKSAGGTGLSGTSEQQFTSISKIYNYDEDNITTIHLRLCCENDNNPRPLKQRETPIPEPLIVTIQHPAKAYCCNFEPL